MQNKHKQHNDMLKESAKLLVKMRGKDEGDFYLTALQLLRNAYAVGMYKGEPHAPK